MGKNQIQRQTNRGPHMQEQDKNKVMANTKIKQIRETKSLNPIWTGGWGWGETPPYRFSPVPERN